MRSILAVVMSLLVAVGSAAAGGQTPQGRTGDGRQLKEMCDIYFAFLGRTGAGREESFHEDPFGMGYCAGLIRGVARSAEAFHPEIQCRLDRAPFHRAVAAVVSYLNNRPQTLDEPDDVLVLRALQLAAICRASGP